jgi:integrase
VKEKKVSPSTCIQAVCALRFLYTHTLNRKVAIERIPFPRRERKLPLVLSREEVKALLEAPKNLRHRTLLAILYGCGLRVSEVARLKVADIDSPRNVLWVRCGKRRKDRQALLPPKLRELLRCYWRSHRPTDWLFPSSDPRIPIATPFPPAGETMFHYGLIVTGANGRGILSVQRHKDDLAAAVDAGRQTYRDWTGFEKPSGGSRT